MKFPDSSTFSIKLCGGQLLSRLAPGMGVSFNINFLPLQYVDYVHCVKFTTDTQEYVLPIIGEFKWVSLDLKVVDFHI